jgi:hypothetical protein
MQKNGPQQVFQRSVFPAAFVTTRQVLAVVAKVVLADHASQPQSLVGHSPVALLFQQSALTVV